MMCESTESKQQQESIMIVASAAAHGGSQSIKRRKEKPTGSGVFLCRSTSESESAPSAIRSTSWGSRRDRAGLEDTDDPSESDSF